MSKPTTFTIKSYVPLNITFNPGSGTSIPSDQIWVAIFGQLIFNQGGGTVPDTGNTYYLSADNLNKNNQPIPQLASNLLPAGPGNPDAPILPSSTLADWTTFLSMPIPEYTSAGGATQFTGRVLISIGAPVQAQVNTDGSVSPPSASNPIDPSSGTFVDFLEFTVQSNSDETNNVDFDTSQVDSFGLPMQLQFFYNEAGSNKPFDFAFTGNSVSGQNTITSGTALPNNINASTLIKGNGIPATTFIDFISQDRKTVTISNNATADNTAATFTSIGAGPVGVQANRNVVFGNKTTALSFAQFLSTIPVAQQTIFEACAPNPAIPMRLIAPKDLAESYISPYTDPLNNYYNSMIDQFFLMYYSGTIGSHTGGGKTFTIQSGASGSEQTYTGNVVLLSSAPNYVLQLQNSAKSETYHIYYPFFAGVVLNGYTPVFTPGPVPAWITKPGESASQMVWACDGVFADNTAQPPGSFNIAVLGDLEDSLSAAFNRGIALLDPSGWGDTSQWFQINSKSNSTGIWNYWVQYWHQQGLAVNGMAYAFPYDDKYGASTNMQQNSVSLIEVTLGSWGSQLLPTITIQAPSTTISQNGPITIQATITGNGSVAPSGTVTFFLNGYPFFTSYPKDTYSILPQTITNGVAKLSGVNCPPMPDGNNVHTYTITAVYSGDSNYLPFVASLPLQLLLPQQFIFNPVDPKIYLGHPLPSGTFVQLASPGAQGTLEVSTWASGVQPTELPDSSTVFAVSKSPVDISSYQVPNLSFQGTLTVGSDVIKNVSSVIGLSVGQGLSGNGIPTGATIKGVTPAPPPPTTITSSVQMSTNAIAPGGVETITSNGINYGFMLQAVFTPKEGSPGTAIVYNFAPVG